MILGTYEIRISYCRIRFKITVIDTLLDTRVTYCHSLLPNFYFFTYDPYIVHGLYVLRTVLGFPIFLDLKMLRVKLSALDLLP